MCAVPNMAVFCSSLTSCFPGMLLTYFVNDFEILLLLLVVVVVLLLLFSSSSLLEEAEGGTCGFERCLT